MLSFACHGFCAVAVLLRSDPNPVQSTRTRIQLAEERGVSLLAQICSQSFRVWLVLEAPELDRPTCRSMILCATGGSIAALTDGDKTSFAAAAGLLVAASGFGFAAADTGALLGTGSRTVAIQHHRLRQSLLVILTR